MLINKIKEEVMKEVIIDYSGQVCLIIYGNKYLIYY